MPEKEERGMLSVKENFFETVKPDGHPDRLMKQYEGLAFLNMNPVLKYIRGDRHPGMPPTKDRFGTEILWPEGQVAAMPHVTEANKVIPDILRSSVSFYSGNIDKWDIHHLLYKVTRKLFPESFGNLHKPKDNSYILYILPHKAMDSQNHLSTTTICTWPDQDYRYSQNTQQPDKDKVGNGR